MTKKIFYVIILSITSSLGGEFTFSHDTVWEHDPYIDSGFNVNSYLINLTSDSLYIDSLALIIDGNAFPKYEIDWDARKNSFWEWYKFGNWPEHEFDYPPIEDYQIHYTGRLIRVAPNDSLELKMFGIDKALRIPLRDNIYHADSIVPITVGIVFFSSGFKDTLTLKGLYDHDISLSIKQINNNINYSLQYNIKPNYFFNCLGRKIELKNSSKKYNRFAKGIYITPQKSRILILHNQIK